MSRGVASTCYDIYRRAFIAGASSGYQSETHGLRPGVLGVPVLAGVGRIGRNIT